MTFAPQETIMRQGLGPGTMTFAELVQAAVARCGGKVEALADELKVSRQTVYKWLGGGEISKKNERRLYKFMGYPQPGVVNVTEMRHPTGRKVPLIDQCTAGRGGVAVDPYQRGAAEGYIDVFTTVSDKTFALRLRGDSMEPDFYEGEIVIIDPELVPEPGDFVAVELFGATGEPGDGEWTFKEYRPRRLQANGFQAFDLVPLNGKYDTISINEPGKGRFLGTMVAHQRFRRR